MKSELDASRVSPILEYNYSHPDTNRANRSVGWQSRFANPHSFIIGDLCEYDSSERLLVLHYHVYSGSPKDLRTVWAMKREAQDMFLQIAQNIHKWNTVTVAVPPISTLIAATHPLLGRIVRTIAPVFHSIGAIPMDSNYYHSLHRYGSDVQVSAHHSNLSAYEILAANASDFITQFS